MRILYCNKYNFGFSGTEAYLFETMELMRSRGHETALFSMANPRGDATNFDHNFVPLANFKGRASFAQKARLGLRAIYSRNSRKKIGRTISEFHPDVAHVRNIYHHLSPSILWELKSRGVPVLYHMNDFKLVCPSYNLVSANGQTCERCKGGRFLNVVREGCYAGGRAESLVLAAEAYFHRWIGTYKKCVDLILAPSQFVKQKLIENGWSASGIEVLPHFQNLPTTATPHPGPYAPILYFGRLSQEKGLSDLLAAMARLPNINLVIAGEGPERSSLEHQVRDLHLNNVRFTGHVSGAALQQLIAASQFTIFPSHAYETLGKSILESYAQGRPVIASDLGSRRELVENGETGLLYRVQDVGELTGVIAFLNERPALAKQMGDAGREFVRSRHSQEEHFLALERIYAGLGRQSGLPNSQARRSRDKAHIAYIGGRGVIGKYSGIETYYEETGKRLVKSGHQVTIYCRNHFTPETGVREGVRILRLPTIRTKHLDTFVHSLISTVHASFSDYDVVHYHTLGPALFSLIPRMFGKKTVVTVQGLDWQRRKWGWVSRQILKLGEWASARFPNETIVVSRTLQRRYRQRHNVEPLYIPNGTAIRFRRDGFHLRQLGLEPDQYVLFLGRFSPEKNCHQLIEAFKSIDAPFKLVLAGGSSHTDEYADAIRRHESERIRVLDWLSGDALDEVLTNAALFVLPSDLEGASLALLDAMGAGVCVLASDAPENCELVEGQGFTFRRGDVGDLRRMLNLLLADTELRESAADLARQHIRKNYLWQTVVESVQDVYGHLMRNDRFAPAIARAKKNAA